MRGGAIWRQAWGDWKEAIRREASGDKLGGMGVSRPERSASSSHASQGDQVGRMRVSRPGGTYGSGQARARWNAWEE